MTTFRAYCVHLIHPLSLYQTQTQSPDHVSNYAGMHLLSLPSAGLYLYCCHLPRLPLSSLVVFSWASFDPDLLLLCQNWQASPFIKVFMSCYWFLWSTFRAVFILVAAAICTRDSHHSVFRTALLDHCLLPCRTFRAPLLSNPSILVISGVVHYRFLDHIKGVRWDRLPLVVSCACSLGSWYIFLSPTQ